MVARKRGLEEMEASEPQTELTRLERLRSTWEFANLMQYIFIFGKAVKIDEEFDIEVCRLYIVLQRLGTVVDDLERECLKAEPSTALSDIGLALLKYVSSHRGLTPDIFDEYTRRQYMAKAPHRNPFGEEEEPKKFFEFDVFTKLKVLVQLSQWTLNNPDRIREKMEERTESEQSLAWRMNEIGYDRRDRYYFVLDDNRLYRRTEAPLPPSLTPKPKACSKKVKSEARNSKRRRTREAEESANDADVETPQPDKDQDEVKESADDDGFGGRKWECVAITLGQYQNFVESIKKSRDPDEKALCKRITEEVMPIIEQAEASQLRKKQKQERELLNMQKLATAKRSSRLEAKMERERQEREEREAEDKRKADLAEAHAYEKKQQKLEEDRESRMMTREQRLKERELKRILHEEELARMSEEEKRVDAGESRQSERHLKVEMEKKKKELAALEEDVWFFDCLKCGVHGENLDDGTHSVACEKCNVWQHSACLGISQQEAEKDDFHFLCHDCKRREEDAKKPKIPSLKFKLGSSSSPPNPKPKVVVPVANEARKLKFDDNGTQPSSKKFTNPDRSHQHSQPQLPRPPLSMQNGMHATVMNGPLLSTYGQVPQKSPQTLYAGSQSYNAIQRPPYVQSSPPAPVCTNGHNHYSKQSQGYGPQAPNQSFQPPPFMGNGYHQDSGYPQEGSYQIYQGGYETHPPQSYQQQSNAHHTQQLPGWSARYVPPPQTQLQRHDHSSDGPPPADQAPFVNALDENRASPSRRSASAHGPSNANDLSPIKNGPSLSPTQHQYKIPSAGFASRPPSSLATPQVNGYPTDDTAITSSQSVGPLSQSPLKHPPGFSPVKHDPPSLQQAVSPGPTQQSFTLSVKGAMSERAGRVQNAEE
ncbi:MAG: hypothetical protein Q9217_000777 [Psora testacea]